jgi:energy-coupling factor transport system ATP-binding protein
MIALRDVSVNLPPNATNPLTALDHVSLQIESGAWVALVGANGSGKTTLLHTIAGLITPARGEIHSDPTWRAALLLQEPDNQFVTSSVRYELALSLPDDADDGIKGERIEAVVERFGLAPLLERNPHRLSGGEKQRLALATVWLREPDLLLLDEPTAYLDGEAASLCVGFVEEAHRRGVTVVWATPGGIEIDRAARVVCLQSGRVVYDGGADGVYGWADRSGFDVVRPPLRRLAGELAGAVSTPEAAQRIAAAAGAGVAELATAIAPLFAHTPPTGGATRHPASVTISSGGGLAPGGNGAAERASVVSLAGVDYGYDGLSAVAGVDLDVREGECVGLTGPNGAGKSTVLGLAAGMWAPTAGSIERWGGRPVATGGQHVFLLFQSPEQMFFAETVAEELAFGLDRLGVAVAERDGRSRSALKRVGLNPESYLDRVPMTLSPGEMRRLAFAIALSLEPQLLLLDEPTSCLDADAIGVLTSILELRRAHGGTTIVASHDAEFLAGVCDRIVWLRDGSVRTETATAGGRLAPGSEWPEERTAVLELQDHLAALGVEVTPRDLTAARLAERLR